MEMTLTRALTELKMLDKRIQKILNEQKFLAYKVGNKLTGYANPDDFVVEAKGEYDKVRDLIGNRKKIKAALVKANATNEITVAGETMTLAEAIERRNIVNYELDLLNVMQKQYKDVTSEIERENERAERRADNLLEKQIARETKTKTEETEEFMKFFMSKNEATLVDPLSIRGEIKTLSEKYDAFITEIDTVLSEKNATTTIEI